jgi:predicted regulator of Ras-like GTPase activity (Roadblock/LC7/MglB family)
MSIEDILKDLVDSTPQAEGAILVDWEGEAVLEQCHGDPYDIRFLAAHQGILLNRFKEIHVEGSMGEVAEVVITARDAHILIGVVDKDYTLVLRVGRRCLVPLALHYFRGAVELLKKEI